MLAEAKLQAAGQMQWTGDYPVQAKLNFSQLDFAPVLTLLNVDGVKGNSQLAGVIQVSGPAKTPRLLDGTAEINQFRVSLQGLAVTSKGPVRASLTDGVVKLEPLELDAEDTNLTAQGTADLMGDGGLNVTARGTVNARLAQAFSPEISSSGHVSFNFTAQGALKKPDLEGSFNFDNVNLAYQELPNGISHLNGALVFNQDRLELRNLVGTTGGGTVTFGGFLFYQQGVYGDITVALKNARFRYAGLSSSADAKLRLQGTEHSMLLSGNIQITRFLVGPNVDFAALTGGSTAVSPPPDPNAFGNRVRLDVHVTSAPQMDFQNSFAQIAGSVNLRIRGTVAQPAVLGRINIADGRATYNGTTYQLQHGDIYFTNPVKIEPVIDLDATTRIEEYDVTIGLHGTASKLTPTFRSEPPLPEADVFSLLAQGRTQEEQSIYSTQQAAAGVNGTTNALLSGALNATVSNRISKLFGVGSVKIDPTYTGSLGQSSARITVSQNIGQQVLLTYATSVNSTTQQLISAQVNLSPTFSVTAVRDEADVFSLVFKVHKRYR
jgi:translocation and assembly module TamB